MKYDSRQNAPRWRTVTAEVRGQEFALADDTGRVTVDASDADVESEVTTEGRCPADGEAAPPRLAPLLTREDGNEYNTVRLTSHDLKVIEQRVDPGSEVTVLGRVGRDGAVTATQVGGVGRWSIAAIAGAAAFQVLFGGFLLSVVWFVALPNWEVIL